MSTEIAPEFASERALLGAAIDSTDTATAVTEKVRPKDLRDPSHRKILETVLDLIGRGEAISPAVIVTEMLRNGLFVGDFEPTYLHTLVAEAALPSEIDFHARAVRFRAHKTGLNLFAGRVRQLAGNNDRTAAEDLELLQSWMDELTGTRNDTETTQASDLVHTVIDEIEQGTDSDRVPTGFIDLDSLMSIRPGQLIVVGARPGIGKSTFGMDVARHVGIKRQEPVYFLTLEMSGGELVKRMISAEGRVSLHAILHHTKDKPILSDDDWARMGTALEKIQKSTITIDDAPGAGLARIRARLRYMKRTTGVRVAVVDYLGILATSGRAENRQQAIAELTRGLKQIAREIGVPIVLLAQLNREVMGRQDRKPMMSDLKDSGAIEADADAVILLHREDAYEKESPRAGEADFIVDKHRHGPTSVVTVAFQGHYSRFVDMAADPDPSPAAHGHLRPVS